LSAAQGGAGRRRIGLFGGSFDPVHAGHLHAARAAQQAFGLDRVVFVPAARSPFKPGQAPVAARHRVAMLERAIAGEPGWSISALEIERGGASYTIDTVRALRAALGEPADAEIYLILGSDNLPGIAGWRDVEELLALVEPVVVYREGEVEELLAEPRARLPRALADKLAAGLLRLPPVRASSSELRAELAAERAPAGVAQRVPAAVLAYIREHGLYRE
jgi:nicotinate-nucleotide adenylyltransferase